MLGELPIAGGSVQVAGGGPVGYASQEAWIFTGTVRDNVLFGMDMDEARYWQVIRACSLDADMAGWKRGDGSAVGERGLALSGGQRARIALARAVYADADAYLLDDVFAAVDPAVGRSVLERCVRGRLSDKAVVLVTHSRLCLAAATKLFRMEDRTLVEVDLNRIQAEEGGEEEKTKNEQIRVSQTLSRDDDADGGQLLRQEGTAVSWSTYRQFLAASEAHCLMFAYALLCLATPVALTASDMFIGFWMNVVGDHPEAAGGLPFGLSLSNDASSNLSAFSVLTASLLATVAAKVLCQYRICLASSRKLHDDMFGRVLGAPAKFFSSTPVGRIMNRFSNDMFAVDEILPHTICEVEAFASKFATALLIVGYYVPHALIPVLPLVVLSLALRSVFAAASDPLKRLEAATRAPLLSQVSSTVAGIVTIRALRREDIMVREFHKKQDVNTSVSYVYTSVTSWFSIWVEALVLAFQAAVLASLLLTTRDRRGPGDVGVILLSTFDLTRSIHYGMRITALLQNVMTSTKRILDYVELQPEGGGLGDAALETKDDWPSRGSIQFRDVSLRYDQEGEPVLKSLSFEIDEQEKVGVIGRTGAGKSSLIAALFRLTEPSSGSVVVDGVRTSSVGLRRLRRSISIIPQEPLLMGGTLRRNLDPFDEFEDAALWHALRQAHLEKLVKNAGGKGLQMEIADGGSNLSTGEKQLVCLARATLRSNKILVLDEATANVDPRTDALIMDAIKDTFEGCTVLIVAHRLHTVMECDRIMVMSDGNILEFDSPHWLLSDRGSALSKLLDKLPPGVQDELRGQAERAHRARMSK